MARMKEAIRIGENESDNDYFYLLEVDYPHLGGFLCTSCVRIRQKSYQIRQARGRTLKAFISVLPVISVEQSSKSVYKNQDSEYF